MNIADIRTLEWFKPLPTTPGRTPIQQAARLIHKHKLTGVALTSDVGKIVAVLPACGLVNELGNNWPNSWIAIAGQPRENYECSGNTNLIDAWRHMWTHQCQHVIVRYGDEDFVATMGDIAKAIIELQAAALAHLGEYAQRQRAA